MNRKLTLLVGAAAILATAPNAGFAQTTAAPADYKAMTFPGWGFNKADLDKSVKPGDDFFAYVNGKWFASETIPPQYPYSGVALNLRLGAERDVRAIVEEMAASQHPAGRIRA